MTDSRPSLAPAFAAFGVDVIIPQAPPTGSLLTVRAIPLSYRQENVLPGTSIAEPGQRMVLAFQRADLDALPRGTLIEAPEISGGTVYTWRVDSVELINAEEVRLIVVRQ